MSKSDTKIPLERVDTYRWRIPKRYNPDMHVPGMVYADDELIEQMLNDNALQQVANVATLPGIVGHSLAMPDIHWGYGFHLVDRQLACLPLQSNLGKAYLSAMACGANFAWANRQMLMNGARQAFAAVFGRKARPKDRPMVYNVCHNIAKMEEYEVDGEVQRLCVHRKGATRAFPANHPALPEQYRFIGQPVLIPGDMGRYSFVLVGAQGSMEQSFGSCCHGAGRRLSRTAAKKSLSSRDLLDQLDAKGITVRVHSKNLLTEEAPSAYKDAQKVVNVVHNAGLAKLVARLKPLIVVKG